MLEKHALPHVPHRLHEWEKLDVFFAERTFGGVGCQKSFLQFGRIYIGEHRCEVVKVEADAAIGEIQNAHAALE